MNTHFENMTNWEIDKAHFLIKSALEYDMKISGYGELNVNPNSGYTYLWLEDYPFCLYMPISCDLIKSDVYVLWTNFENGEEVEESLSSFGSLDHIYEWVSKLEEVTNED